ncbi:hypothetical protein CGSHi3655_00180 [Haemophilus influenzae 3655]|nr:hypothetical protein CGSHi3655_00180 [Haemophilus influenzae 3655]
MSAQLNTQEDLFADDHVMVGA